LISPRLQTSGLARRLLIKVNNWQHLYVIIWIIYAN
jgi:hypothetical protein